MRPARRRTRTSCALWGVAAALGAALGAAVVPPAGAQAILEGVQISVTVHADGQVEVVERYRVPENTSGKYEFRLLARPCAVTGAVRLSNYATEFPLESATRGPWTTYVTPGPDRSSYSNDSAGFTVRYDAHVSGRRADIPIAHLTQPIVRSNGDRAVSIAVDASAIPDARVTFPHFEQHSSNSWRAHFVAVPSFVRVESRAGVSAVRKPCDETTRDPLDDGGLSWRFWLFAGIMGVWVPIYLAWAGRRREDDA